MCFGPLRFVPVLSIPSSICSAPLRCAFVQFVSLSLRFCRPAAALGATASDSVRSPVPNASLSQKLTHRPCGHEAGCAAFDSLPRAQDRRSLGRCSDTAGPPRAPSCARAGRPAARRVGRYLHSSRVRHPSEDSEPDVTQDSSSNAAPDLPRIRTRSGATTASGKITTFQPFVPARRQASDG